MPILVTYASRGGGTEVVAQTIVGTLREAGRTAVALPCAEAGPVLSAFDAVIVGGELRAGRWPLALRWFVRRRAAQLRRVAVWFFSAEPVDESGDREDAPPSSSVRALIERASARGHATFCIRPLLEGRGAATEERGAGSRSRGRILAWARQVALASGSQAPTPSGVGARARQPRVVPFSGPARASTDTGESLPTPVVGREPGSGE